MCYWYQIIDFGMYFLLKKINSKKKSIAATKINTN